MPQLPKREIEKLYKTFMLYTKVKREEFPLLKKAEEDEGVLLDWIKKYRSS
jgi:hypothetical protein